MSSNISMPKFTWLRSQWQNERRDEQMLVEEELDDVSMAQPTKTNFFPRNDRNFYIEIILLVIAALMFTGMIVSILMLAMHDGRSVVDAREELPSAFELKHTKVSDLSICLAIFKTSDASGACLVHTDQDFYGAQVMCDKYGMELLEISSEDVKIKIYEETKKLFGSGGGTRIWINGKWSKSKKEWLTHPKNMSFFLTTDHVAERGWGVIEQEGNCLAIESIRRDLYQISSCSCQGNHYFYCGY